MLADLIEIAFPLRVNQHLDQVREHLAAWLRRTGLVRRDDARMRFDSDDVAWWAAAVYPTADGERLELLADCLAWMLLVDDDLDDSDGGPRPQAALQLAEAMRATMENRELDPAPPEGHDARSAIDSFAELWRRLEHASTPRWRRRFAGHLGTSLTTAVVWEADNRARGRVPDEATYIEHRRHTGTMYALMHLIEIAERIDVPAWIYADAGFQAAIDAACNVVLWTNDVYSFEKERSYGDVHNLVYVVQHHRGLGPHEALTRVCAAVSAEIHGFLDVERDLLHAHPEHHDVLAPYLDGMRAWMRGNLEWSRRTPRFRLDDGAAGAPSGS